MRWPVDCRTIRPSPASSRVLKLRLSRKDRCPGVDRALTTGSADIMDAIEDERTCGGTAEYLHRPSRVPLLLAELAAAQHDELRAGQLFESHRSTGMDAGRTDADFGAQPELIAVVESRRRVDKDGAGIHFAEKTHGFLVVAGDDGFRMTGAVAADVFHCFVDVLDDLHREDQIEELFAVVAVAGRFRGRR